MDSLHFTPTLTPGRLRRLPAATLAAQAGRQRRVNLPHRGGGFLLGKTKSPQAAYPVTPSPLRERGGVRVQIYELAPPHPGSSPGQALASPPPWGEEFQVVGQPLHPPDAVRKLLFVRHSGSRLSPGQGHRSPEYSYPLVDPGFRLPPE